MDAETARTWAELADANALNLLAPHVGVVVVDDAGRRRWAEDVRRLLASTTVPGADIPARAALREGLMAAAGAVARAQPIRPRTAALIVGSAKVAGTSVSENLARALSARLEAEGVTTAIHAATDFLREERARGAARAVAAADLFGTGHATLRRRVSGACDTRARVHRGRPKRVAGTGAVRGNRELRLPGA